MPTFGVDLKVNSQVFAGSQNLPAAESSRLTSDDDVFASLPFCWYIVKAFVPFTIFFHFYWTAAITHRHSGPSIRMGQSGLKLIVSQVPQTLKFRNSLLRLSIIEVGTHKWNCRYMRLTYSNPWLQTRNASSRVMCRRVEFAFITAVLWMETDTDRDNALAVSLSCYRVICIYINIYSPYFTLDILVLLVSVYQAGRLKEETYEIYIKLRSRRDLYYTVVGVGPIVRIFGLEKQTKRNWGEGYGI